MFKRDTKNSSQLILDPYYLKDPKLYEIFQKSLPPPEAYYFFHKSSDYIKINYEKPQNSIRQIFTNVPYTDFEKKWLKELDNIIDSNDAHKKIPFWWNDGMSLIYIYTTIGDIEYAYELIIDYINWFENTFPINIQPKDKCWELLNSGFLYIYGRDHQFRPIIICQPYILQDKMEYYSNEDIQNVCFFVCQYAVNNLLIPGQIENWIMFFNLEGTSLLTLPKPIKNLLQELSDYFNFRLHRCYILGMSFLMRILYKFVSNFVGQPDEDKMIILEGREDEHLFDEFNPDNLEQRFGGRAPNLIYGVGDCLFPPRVASNNVFLKNEDPKKILITEEEYIEKYKKGLIPIQSISPYIEDKLNEIEEKEKEKIRNTITEEKKSSSNNTQIKVDNLPKIPKSIFQVKRTVEIKRNKVIDDFIFATNWNINDDIINHNINKAHLSYIIKNDVNLFFNRKNKFINDLVRLEKN